MTKRVLSIAMAFVGLSVGAGFASGQEVMQFFVHFGTAGLWSAVFVAVLLALGGMIVLQLGSYYQANEHTAVLDEVTHPLLAKALDWAVIVTVFSIGFVMFAGGGANLNQAFGIPNIWGTLLLLAIVLFVGKFDVDKVSNAIAFTTPLIIVLVLLTFLYSLATNHYPVETLNAYAGQVKSTLPTAFIAAINYGGLTFILVVSMSIVIGGYYLNPRSAGLGGLLGGLIFGLMLVISAVCLFLNVPDVYDSALPMLKIVQEVHPWLGYVMSIAIFAMIFNTAIGMFYSLAKRLTAKKSDKAFYPTFVASCLVGFVVSFIGFKNLVSYVYPVLGYIGFVLFVILLVAWAKDIKEIRKETRRRKKIRKLLLLKLNPRRDFSPAHEKRLKQHLHNSVVEDGELADAFDEKMDEYIREQEQNHSGGRNLQ
ncbi:hypothetical protein ACFSSC_06640 [Corynebacterium mendelii]|uniref:Membrane protein YkvI n=1 Tax=Corynebacterium mendelii TaxID=2765362 RepID=A0A939IYT1_9CORY|nr:hypothetical protein [Corynebacterium mendelii]MBN9644992.1 hypothetical protein [Corynebacterium mendelii]